MAKEKAEGYRHMYTDEIDFSIRVVKAFTEEFFSFFVKKYARK